VYAFLLLARAMLARAPAVFYTPHLQSFSSCRHNALIVLSWTATEKIIVENQDTIYDTTTKGTSRNT
jgi:hypothetical protein